MLAPLTPDRHDYDPTEELASSDLFTDIEEHRFGFQMTYTADEFLALIRTYASHEALDPPTRSRLHARLRATIDSELGGIATKPYEALLVIGTAKAPTR